MSKFRDRAREIKAAGEAERGNFTPTGVPLRTYNYWLENSESNKAALIRLGGQKENFCHFWRVVVLWAPLLFLFNKSVVLAGNTAFQLAAFSALVLGVIALGLTYSEIGAVIVYSLIGTAIAALLVFSAFAGVSLAQENDEERERLSLPPAHLARYGVVGLPSFALAYVLTKLVKAERMGDLVIFLGIGSLVALVAFVVIMEGVMSLLVGTAILLAIVAAAVVISAFFAALAGFLEGKRALAKEKAAERRESEPEAEVSSEPREPGRIERFFSGVADFIILVSQIVRVNKWKICPIVEVDRENAV